jgi:hypothetical protein
MRRFYFADLAARDNSVILWLFGVRDYLSNVLVGDTGLSALLSVRRVCVFV